MILYLETSDLVKLYVREDGSDAVRQAVSEASSVASSSVAYVEARAAFARKFRERGLTAKTYAVVKDDLDRDWERIFVLNLTAAVVRVAGDLAEKHGLRGYDAIHLASALELKNAVPSPIRFSSSDTKLADAARSEGLLIAEENG
jgi:predicted nucleic acid-binding protein